MNSSLALINGSVASSHTLGTMNPRTIHQSICFLSAVCCVLPARTVSYAVTDGTTDHVTSGDIMTLTPRIAQYDVESMENTENTDTEKSSNVSPKPQRRSEENKGENHSIDKQQFSSMFASLEEPQRRIKKGGKEGSSTHFLNNIFLSDMAPNLVALDNKSNTNRKKSSKENTPISVKRNTTKIYDKSNSKRDKPEQEIDVRPEVLVGVILPAAGTRPFRVVRVAPALEKAVDELSTGGNNSWRFKK